MSNPEYDGGEPAVDNPTQSPDGLEDEREARKKERLKALEDEAIEGEHLDQFLAGGSHEF